VKVHWTARALADFARLHGFMFPEAPVAAANLIDHFREASARLALHPRIGQRVPRHTRREVRRIIAGDYEMRYEIVGREIYILRVWHGREDRPQ
jgi:plasmid stabilization system protein ParE